MSRYDGLIIPRSYSDYINKTDAATLLQALQLSGVMDAAPTAGSNHPVKSGGVAKTFSNINAIEQTPNTKNTLWLNGTATPDSATVMNVVFSFPFYLKNPNYTINVKQLFIENIGLKNNPNIVNTIKYEGGFTVFIGGYSNLAMYAAYNVRMAEIELTFA